MSQTTTTTGNIPKLRIRLLMVACLISCLFFASSFGSDRDAEYRLKAAFIYNFTQYFEWEPRSTEMVVGVLGNSPIYDQLVQIARAKSGGDKKMVVKQYSSLKDVTACNFLFIPQNSGISLEDILSKIPKGTLTITERPGSGAQGSAINFIIVNNKLKFESNLKTINAAGVKASSQLLKLAIIVE